MKTRNANRFLHLSAVIIGCLLLLTGSSYATSDKQDMQQKISFSVQEETQAITAYLDQITNSQNTYSFIRKDKNSLQNDTIGMARFYRKLLELRQGKIEHVNVLQIGDSHLESGFLPTEVRDGLQGFFGDSGRGLVFPYRSVGGGEAFDISLSTQGWIKGSSSTKTYTIKKGDTKSGIAKRLGKTISSLNRLNPGLSSRKILKPGQVLIVSSSNQIIPPGISGYSLKTSSNVNKITVNTKPTPTSSQKFNGLSLILDSTEKKINIEISDVNGKILAKSTYASPEVTSVPLAWADSVNVVQIKVNSTNGTNPSVILYVIDLERTNSGLSYHSIGLNGAGFAKYNKNARFFSQLPFLKPDLVIVSLGTNDAMGNFRPNLCEQDALEFISNIMENLPDTDVLLTTPPSTYKATKRGKVEIQAIPQISEMMRDIAAVNDLAWWNLYEVMGGQGSMKKWFGSGLAQADHKHFKANGYKEQGVLLRDAILRGYADYVAKLAK